VNSALREETFLPLNTFSSGHRTKNGASCWRRVC
jgi:hypothetical protein